MPKTKTSRVLPQDDGTALVELTQDKWAIIDIEDAEEIGKRKWHYSHGYTTGYACRSDGKQMHRIILGLDSQVDHINRNGLDNRRSNLRPCTNTINKLNERTRKDNTSGDSGIHLRPWGKWQARIAVGNKRYSLGHFDSYGDAKFCMDSMRKIIADILAEINKLPPTTE